MISDSDDWVNNRILPLLEKKIAYMISQSYIIDKKDPRISTYLGLDLIIDDQFDARIIDINFNPAMRSRYQDQ